jgi:hypothetical protein
MCILLNNCVQTRRRIHEGHVDVFKRWQSEEGKRFDYWFDEEISSFGRSTIQKYLDYLKKLAAISTGQTTMSLDAAFPPPEVWLINSLHGLFKNSGITEVECLWQKTTEFFNAPHLKNIPFLKISCMLYAAIARKAAAGQKKPPNQGMANDIEIVSVLLPYCDSMFIDNQCHAYLKEKPLCDEVDYGTKIFSPNTKNEFLEYLSDIERSATKEHMEKLDEVYGDGWRRPFLKLYEHEENR